MNESRQEPGNSAEPELNYRALLSGGQVTRAGGPRPSSGRTNEFRSG